MGNPTEGGAVQGLIRSFKAVPGRRDARVSIRPENAGCLAGLVAEDATDPGTIWIGEAWDGAESQQAPLAIPAAEDAITRATPLVAGFGARVTTRLVGGQGWRAAR